MKFDEFLLLNGRQKSSGKSSDARNHLLHPLPAWNGPLAAAAAKKQTVEANGLSAFVNNSQYFVQESHNPLSIQQYLPDPIKSQSDPSKYMCSGNINNNNNNSQNSIPIWWKRFFFELLDQNADYVSEQPVLCSSTCAESIRLADTSPSPTNPASLSHR